MNRVSEAGGCFYQVLAEKSRNERGEEKESNTHPLHFRVVALLTQPRVRLLVLTPNYMCQTGLHGLEMWSPNTLDT